MKQDEIVEYLDDVSYDDLIDIFREYCMETNNYDDEIFRMECLNEVFEGQTPDFIINRCFYGDFNPNRDYFMFDGYGNLKSLYGVELKDYIDLDDIAEYCVGNNEDLFDSSIRSILDEEEEEED